ncbi:MAG: alpha-amylase family glycosyl hydrolase, partial [Myxococcota bacterium]
AASANPDFSWDNATVYFLMTDRFKDGMGANNVGYPGRETQDEGIGGWYGGDFVGLTSELDYLENLGIDVIWLSFPVEQVHGYVGGGDSGDFQHFAYHGYWPLDFTRIDANYGTEAELQTFVDEAHARGIRVVFDVVLNHAGYATLADLGQFLPSVLQGDWQNFMPTGDQSWHTFNDFIDFGSSDWLNWWGRDWIRAGFTNHIAPGSDDLTLSLSFLPDFRTENPNFITPPPFYANKSDTRAETIADFTLREYLVKWVTDWVAQFGVDGFRCDTAKHVEFATWQLLKDEATRKLEEWKAANPDKALDDLPFWMTGEVFPHGVTRDEYFDNGFDSLINFNFQRDVRDAVESPEMLSSLYESYASSINSDSTFNVLSYISSHDTFLFFPRNGSDVALQNDVGTAFMMLPGAVQIFYGDESGRTTWGSVSDPKQGTRSPMNWDSINQSVHDHWQKLGQFRKRHPAIGAGTHTTISTADGDLVFSRQLGEDAVVVAIINNDA